MKLIIILSIVLSCANVCVSEECPNERAFREKGWVVHSGNNFDHLLKEKLNEFLPEIGHDLVIDCEASYMSDYSYDEYLIMWIMVLDRVSTSKDEMWGDIALSKTGSCTDEYTEIRWYDPETKKKHIVCNPDYTCCLTTKVPLAYNTIF